MKNMKRIVAFVLMLVLMFQTVTPVEAAKVKLNKKKISLCTGETYQLKVTGTNKKVKWSTSNKKIATVNKGKVTAKRKGTATITAKVGEKKYTCKVTVKKAKLECDGWMPEVIKIEKYSYYPPVFKTNVKNVTWSSSNTKVANVIPVSSNGDYAWIWGYGVGTATITVKAGDVKKTIKVEVYEGKQKMKYNEFKWTKEDAKVCDGYSNFADWAKYQYSKTKISYWVYWEDKKNPPKSSLNRGITLGSTSEEVLKAYRTSYDYIEELEDGTEQIVTMRYLDTKNKMHFFKVFVCDKATNKVIKIYWMSEKCV